MIPAETLETAPTPFRRHKKTTRLKRQPTRLKASPCLETAETGKTSRVRVKTNGFLPPILKNKNVSHVPPPSHPSHPSTPTNLLETDPFYFLITPTHPSLLVSFIFTLKNSDVVEFKKKNYLKIIKSITIFKNDLLEKAGKT